MGLLDGRTAIVTGGSRGLGRAVCVALAGDGADVAFCYRADSAAAAETVAAVTALGRRCWPYQVSVLDRDGVRAMAAEVAATAGAIDILVNNAGHGQVVPLALMEEDDWDRMMDTHVKGAFLATQAVLRTMVKQRRGRILNVSSLAGVKMLEAPVHYATAKAALRGFTEALAKEIGRYGITVNCVAPGVLEEGVSDHLPDARRAEYLRHCAVRRLGRLDEAAGMIALMCSDRASYVNGATLVVDGGV